MLDQLTSPNQLYIITAAAVSIVVAHVLIWLFKRKRRSDLYDPFKMWSWASHLWAVTFIFVLGVFLWQGISDLFTQFQAVEKLLNANQTARSLPVVAEFDVALLTTEQIDQLVVGDLAKGDLIGLEEQKTIFGSVLVFDNGRIGFFYQATLNSGIQYFAYQPILKLFFAVWHLSLPIQIWVFVFIIAVTIYLDRSTRRVADSLRSLNDVIVLGAEPSVDPKISKSSITRAVISAVLQSKARQDAYLNSYRKLMDLEKPLVFTMTKEVVGKWLFSPMQPLRATSLRFIFPPSAQGAKQHESISSLGTKDPYGEFDPLILSISQRTDRLILQDTSQLLRNGVNTSAALPKSIFVVNIVADGRKHGILWGGFAEAHEFDPEETELIDVCAKNAMSMLSSNKQFESEARSVDRLRSILNGIPTPIFTVDHTSKIDFANQNATFLFGGDLTTKLIKDIPTLRDNTTLRQLISSPERVEMSVETQFPDEQVYQCSISGLVVDGKVVGRVFTLLNITEIRNLEKQQSDFVNTVSHDLRQPLTLIRGYANMVEMVGELNSTQIDYLKKISDGVDNMSEMVSSLLDLGRVEAGIGLQIEIVSARDLVEKISRSFQLLAAQKQITFEVAFVETDIMIQADWSLLKQALTNVLENAVKYSNPGGQVKLKVSKVDDELELVVSDTGIGISEEDQRHLFERFFRGKNEIARSRKGTGLGLSIVKSIVDKHGGKIEVESKPGKGTKFSITIPLRQN